jgi:hypothetical protein
VHRCATAPKGRITAVAASRQASAGIRQTGEGTEQHQIKRNEEVTNVNTR